MGNLFLDNLPVMPTAGIFASANFTPVAAAYSAGDVMGSSMEFAWTFPSSGLAIPAGSLIRVLSAIVKIDLTAVPSGQTSYTLRTYSVTQPSAQADNDAWTLVSGDLASYRGPLSLGTPVDEGSCLYIKSQYIDTDIRLATSSLWGRLITDGGHTVASTPPDRQVSLYGVLL